MVGDAINLVPAHRGLQTVEARSHLPVLIAGLCVDRISADRRGIVRPVALARRHATSPCLLVAVGLKLIDWLFPSERMSPVSPEVVDEPRSGRTEGVAPCVLQRTPAPGTRASARRSCRWSRKRASARPLELEGLKVTEEVRGVLTGPRAFERDEDRQHQRLVGVSRRDRGRQ